MKEQTKSIDEYFGRDKESFAFAKPIIKPYGSLNEILDWCKTEMQQDWRWQMIELSSSDRPGTYIFYFDSEKDCLAFTLKWV